MNSRFDNFTEEAIEKHGALLPHELITAIFDIVAADPANADEGPANIFANTGKRQYQIAPFKLASGLAGLVKAFIDPPSMALEGIAVVAAIATISESVRKITLDQGALCQALYEARRFENRRFLSQADLKTKLVLLTGEEGELQSRYSSAIAALLSLQMINLDAANDTVELVETVFVLR